MFMSSIFDGMKAQFQSKVWISVLTKLTLWFAVAWVGIFSIAGSRAAAGNAISGGNSTLNITDFGAVGDAVGFTVSTVSNSTTVSVVGTNTFDASYVGKVIEVFRAGPWVYYNNSVVVTQQDIICTITSVNSGTNLGLSIPCGWTMHAYCVVGTNNAPAFQTAVNTASNLVATGAATNVTINIPSGTYLLCSSAVLNSGYSMGSIATTHPAVTISCGGITFLGASATNTTLLGCGAGMNHPVQSMYPSGEAPYVPMRDTLIYCQGPVVNSQYPLVFQNLTMDGGVQQGAQSYYYWTISQGDGSGWDTTHHAVADSGGVNNVNGALVQWQMHQLKVFTNCVFQHWRGEVLISWVGTGGTNTFNDIANCTFYDGNATADNMYFGQHVHGCTFNQMQKVIEYYMANATSPSVFENNMWTNIIAGYALTIVGATTNNINYPYSISNNLMYEQGGENAIQFSPAANVIVSSNEFVGNGGCIVFTGTGVQPSDGTAIPIMTNIVIANNFFSSSLQNMLTMDGYPVANVLITNNIGLTVSASAGYKANIVLANNSGAGVDGRYDVSGTTIQAGSYMLDLTNNTWCLPNSSPDGGAYSSYNVMSYGNGHTHRISVGSAAFYLDDSNPAMIPAGAVISVTCNTWSGSNATNFYTSKLAPGTPITIANGTAMNFYWNGTSWKTSLTINPPSPPYGLKITAPQ